MRAKIKSSFITASAALLLFSGVASAAAPAASQVSPPISILLDGYPLPFPVAPFIANDTTMVPFRAIAEALHVQVAWSNATQSLTATKAASGTATAATTVVLRKNDKKAVINGQQQQLRVAPTLKDGSLFIPLSFFSSAFGAAVSWDGSLRTVSIGSPVEPMYAEAFYAISSFKKVSLVPKFNAVDFGWTRIDETGNLVLNGKDFYWPQPAGDVTPEAIVQDAANAGGSPSLMAVATDGHDELSKLLSDKALQQTVIAQLVKLAADNHFSGITLDFEGLGLNGDLPAIQQSFTNFVQLLDQSATAANLKLTLALHPLNSSYHGYDYKKLGALADEIILMAYDYSYEKGPEPTSRVNEAIQLAMQAVPASKLVLGISLGSENAQSVGAKLGLAKRYGMKGVAFWYLGILSDDMLNAIQQSIVLKQG